MQPLTRDVLLLGSGQLLSYASSYYLPALLAAPMASATATPLPWVLAAFSLALVVSALIGPMAGRCIDRHGGRLVLLLSNLLFAAGLLALACAQGPVSLLAAWALLGLAMGAGLYEAAFSALVGLYGQKARGGITGITLLGGFASTLGWPLTAWMEAHWGWRGACLGWAALHLLVGLPLHAWLSRPKRAARSQPLPHGTHAPLPMSESRAVAAPPEHAWRTTLLLSLVFAIAWFGSTSLGTHLPQVLQLTGLTLTQAIAIASLVGPAQVAGRLIDFGLRRRFPALLSAKLATLAHPVGAALLLLLGAPAALAFTLLHGAGIGVLTIAKGTLPLLYFGAHGYGERQGLLMLPARIGQALAPVVFSLLLQRLGVAALLVTSGLGLLAWLALRALGEPPARLGTPSA
ncbi:MFS transporter [Simplicispira hankyongi]|uniref:MFS transporter n=1 Tax=Simplicispira hankyongi TaxID=2315688 RepID=A0A398CCV0_9BURK|nr:MFS transporter [Simplicispira hankyongi]